jgi:hypothetical protein
MFTVTSTGVSEYIPPTAAPTEPVTEAPAPVIETLKPIESTHTLVSSTQANITPSYTGSPVSGNSYEWRLRYWDANLPDPGQHGSSWGHSSTAFGGTISAHKWDSNISNVKYDLTLVNTTTGKTLLPMLSGEINFAFYVAPTEAPTQPPIALSASADGSPNTGKIKILVWGSLDMTGIAINVYNSKDLTKVVAGPYLTAKVEFLTSVLPLGEEYTIIATLPSGVRADSRVYLLPYIKSITKTSDPCTSSGTIRYYFTAVFEGPASSWALQYNRTSNNWDDFTQTVQVPKGHSAYVDLDANTRGIEYSARAIGGSVVYTTFVNNCP